jgi:serine/threonine protein phosphatase PrpC
MISNSIATCFMQMDQIVGNTKTVDSSLSGSTVVIVIIIDDKLWCANVGDSRAVLRRKLCLDPHFQASAITSHLPALKRPQTQQSRRGATDQGRWRPRVSSAQLTRAACGP